MTVSAPPNIVANSTIEPYSLRSLVRGSMALVMVSISTMVEMLSRFADMKKVNAVSFHKRSLLFRVRIQSVRKSKHPLA